MIALNIDGVCLGPVVIFFFVILLAFIRETKGDTHHDD